MAAGSCSNDGRRVRRLRRDGRQATGRPRANWFTVNEIPCFIGKGYGDGYFAPGRQLDARSLNQAYHHALLAHGAAVAAVRAHGGSGARVGLVHNHLPAPPIPVIETDEHIAAARAEYAQTNHHLMAPVFLGAYPDEFLAGPDAPASP